MFIYICIYVYIYVYKSFSRSLCVLFVLHPTYVFNFMLTCFHIYIYI